MVDTGIEIIKTRNKFAKSASEGLQKIETALPYLVAARATQAVSAQDTEGVTYTGTALAVPRTSESDFVALEGQKSRPMRLKTHRKIWSAQPRSCRKLRKRRRRPKTVPGLLTAVARIKVRSAAVRVCGNARKVWQSFQILRICTMPRASLGSRKWHSIARRLTTARVLQVRRLRVQVSR